jgi:cytidylate kinase
MRELLITIDGPAGAGKTTISRALAERLGYQYIDTGALYRGVAVVAARNHIAAEDDEGLKALCANLSLRFAKTSQGSRLLANDVDITELLRTPEISMKASAVSARPVVREFLLELQRKLGREKSVVFEGRDMGTVVFPDADVKFFLEASAEIRAKRRYDELTPESDVTLEAVTRDMKTRDHNDSTRSLAPLKPADDAFVIDSTSLTIEAVLECMLDYIETKNSI